MIYNPSMVKGKNILVVGLANKYSIAAAISSSLYENGATLGFSYQNERFEKFINEFSKDNGGDFTQVCDLSSDNDIKKLISTAIEKWGKIDGIVHSVGFAPADQISGNIEDCITREGFQITHDVSSYSFAGLLKEAHPHMSENSSIITLTYVGSQEATPNYNVMGMAKASLEASVRYFASTLGPKGIRVNSISAGPIKTLAASGIKGFKSMLNKHGANTPLARNITSQEVGNTATFLLSDMSSGITGQNIYVDGGYTIQAISFD
tara:strand:+ start:220 stop:1011 length:792 start_codon:yes stop_codon:yes gene_type:complete